ncbi:MAG: extracellular solute-binding protein [Candidatus Omnitrophica bacterium]|nr:extracellular solute-binding protein [Candidatus Omnitrophota bacterium]
MRKKFYLFLIFALLNCGCQKKYSSEVIVYVAHDQIYSEPILKEFERETGIKVKAVYDLEATKTTGIVNRLIAEKDSPRCDVFWNNEISRTIMLKDKGILSPYYSLRAKDIPDKFKDKDGFWTGFAARARIIIYNKNLLPEEEIPQSIYALLNPKYRGKIALANPLFGTTSTHASALFSYLGEEKAKEFFQKLKENKVLIVHGNSIVKDVVASGEALFGITDTDDANVALQGGKPVGIVYPDQEDLGTLIIPNTLSLIKGAHHLEEAKKLIDYLLQPEVEEKLANSQAVQIPLNPKAKKPPHILDISSIKTMEVDFEDCARRIEEVSKYLQENFIR